jgi:hypothetical protein
MLPCEVCFLHRGQIELFCWMPACRRRTLPWSSRCRRSLLQLKQALAQPSCRPMQSLPAPPQPPQLSPRWGRQTGTRALPQLPQLSTTNHCQLPPNCHPRAAAGKPRVGQPQVSVWGGVPNMV